MRTFGLLGYPLSHSFSRSFFTEKFVKENIADSVYENFSFENIHEAVRHLKSLVNLAGFNITIPHKLNILPYLNFRSQACEAIQSCNCVKVEKGSWTGHNTDVIGFSKSLTPLLKPQHTKALVFGTGGASRAIVYVLGELGISYQMVSRSAGKSQTLSYDKLTPELIRSHPLLINTTPLGMYPDTDKALPIDYHALGPDHLVYDLIYNPAETLFLKNAKAQGATTKNGEEMLIIQAEESWRIWNS